MDKRSIEESFPVKEVSENSVKEKSIRRGHISALHIWWARRPLVSSRATNYAALISEPSDEIEWIKNRNFIIDLSKWENSSNKNIINQARNNILDFNNGIPPKVLDPFSGGGAIPLESLRLGCETYANDYNPIAVLLEKCTMEYPQRYGNSSDTWSEKENSLVNDVKKWSNWVLIQSKRELKQFFPKEKDGSIPVGYFWARAVSCQNPSCGVSIPLIRQFWLAKKDRKKISLKLKVKDTIKFEIVGDKGKIPKNFDPSKGTISKAVVTCPICNSTIDPKITRKLLAENKTKNQMLAVALYNPQKKGKKYRVANNEDLKIFENSETYLSKKSKDLNNKWHVNPVPDEPLPPIGTLGFRVQRYGITNWGDLFNSRQKLILITFAEKIRLVYEKMLHEGLDEEYAKAVTTYIALMVSRCSDFESNVVRWFNHVENTCNTFSRQAIPMMWDFFELNLFSPSSQGTFISMQRQVTKALAFLTEIKYPETVKITHSSATNLPYPNNFFDAIFTDPPYYDNVPYSHLSDFFYVWLKRMIGHLYPELFLTPLTPKKEEIVAYSHLPGGFDAGKNFFEEMLKKSFQEIYRVLKQDGISTIVYAHKTTEGWETVINALLDSGLVVTASWPLSTEMRGRLRALNSASLASSIYIVTRKIKKEGIGWFKDVKDEIENYIPLKLDKLWEEGISGADFFIAAIGSAIEIFGKYEKVLDNEGNEIRADKLLTFVRDVVTDYTVRQILHNGIADELSALTKFYLMWRWNYQDVRVPFDDARKLAQSAGIDLANEWNHGFITKRGEFITAIGPDKRDKESLEDSKELIDVLHYVCLLWKEGKQDKIKYVLKKSSYGEGEAIYKVAQAISETLPNNSSEKKMIEGFLAGKDKIIEDMREDEPQTKLV